MLLSQCGNFLKTGTMQGWDLLIGFLSESLKKTSDLLIRSFLESDLSDSLMVAHFW